jgi:SAM-dependent methyltransferase
VLASAPHDDVFRRRGSVSAADEHLEAAFGRAEPEHFAWQTEGTYVADEERALVRAAFEPLGARVLDLGCGEGATLVHLGEPAGAVGVDLFEPKLVAARARLPKCEFVACSALSLPFDDGRFDHVLVRDVIHHIEEPDAVLDEIARVLAPGGRVDVLEPCRYNPLIALHALTNVAERLELRSTPTFLERLVARRFARVTVERFQPLPVHRVLFHPKLGRPRAADIPLVRAAVGAFERAAGRVLPRLAWAYIHVRGEGR